MVHFMHFCLSGTQITRALHQYTGMGAMVVLFLLWWGAAEVLMLGAAEVMQMCLAAVEAKPSALGVERCRLLMDGWWVLGCGSLFNSESCATGWHVPSAYGLCNKPDQVAAAAAAAQCQDSDCITGTVASGNTHTHTACTHC